MATRSTAGTPAETTDSAPADEATTTLDKDVTKPSVTAPGDGPADTTDPSEVAHTATPNPGPEAIAVGTVNAVVPGTPIKPKAAKSKPRTEEYEATKPDGTVVRVRRNIETGASEIVEK